MGEVALLDQAGQRGAGQADAGEAPAGQQPRAPLPAGGECEEGKAGEPADPENEGSHGLQYRQEVAFVNHDWGTLVKSEPGESPFLQHERKKMYNNKLHAGNGNPPPPPTKDKVPIDTYSSKKRPAKK